jgi:hypothetical protein
MPIGRHTKSCKRSCPAECVADDVSDRLDLHLPYLPATRHLVTVQQRVPQLVHESLDCLRRRDIRTHGDLLVEEVAVAVLASALVTNNLESVPGRYGESRRFATTPSRPISLVASKSDAPSPMWIAGVQP